MIHRLAFSELVEYDAGQEGITAPVVLRIGATESRLAAKLDTGASHCIFQRSYAEELGLDIEHGHPLRFGTATGSFLTYGHTVTLIIRGFAFDVMAYFADDYAFNRNVLGRHGFLNLVRLGLIDYDGKLYLSLYGDQANGEA